MKEALALSLPWPLPLRRLLLDGRLEPAVAVAALMGREPKGEVFSPG